MPKRIDGRRLRRRAPPLLACLLVALTTVALATGCGNSDRSDSGSSSASTSASRSTTSTTPPSPVDKDGVRIVVPVRPVKQDRFAYARARFVELCAGCHTLADAGATGRRFNLDAAGGDSETHIRYAIADGEPGMPAWRDVLSAREYEELVTYLVAVIGRGTAGDDYWQDQLKMRGEGTIWTRAETERLEAFARRMVHERMRSE